ncbi:Neurofibromin 1, partial [Quaeritorhiza haematococci]
ILFSHLEQVVARFFDANGEAYCHEKNTLFIENSISVLKFILERAEELSQDHLNNVDFGGLIVQFVQYLNRLGTLSQQLPVALRIKVKMCQLAEVLVAKKEIVGLRQEIRFRNYMVETFLEWNSEFAMKTNDSNLAPEEVYNSKNQKLHRDLDQACMKAMVSLLVGLPLQPTSDHSGSGHHMSASSAGPRGSAASDQSEYYEGEGTTKAKSQLFYKYLSFFLKVLQKCKILETIETSHSAPGGNSLNPDLQNVLNKSKEAVQHLAPLKEYTILALSNLLSANIDIGLKYSLSMGYHEDSKTRAAFMQVLTNILNMNAREGFNALGEEGQVMHERYERLLALVTEPDLSIVAALCEVAPVGEIDDIAQTLVNITEAKGMTMKLLKKVIENEVLKTDSHANLFRRNSMATRLLTIYAKSQGSEYLRHTLQPVMQDLVNSPTPLTFELDPNKLSPRDNPEQNMRNLKRVSQNVLDSIIGSVSKVPRSLREVCHHIYHIVGQRFQRDAVIAVGGFIFLRFFCPAIVAPETFDLVQQPITSKDLRRGLVLVTKVVQTLANNVLFGIREKFMEGLNDLLRENIQKVHGFLHEVSTLPPGSQNDVPSSLGRIEEIDMRKLHRYLARNLDKIERIQGIMFGPQNRHRQSVPGQNGALSRARGAYHRSSRSVTSLTAFTESTEGDVGTSARSSPEGRSTNGSAVGSELDRMSNPITGIPKKKFFAQLSTLLAQLGPPPDTSKLELTMSSQAITGPNGHHRYNSGTIGSSHTLFMDFMMRVEGRAGSMKAVQALKERKCFYEGGMSKDRHPVLYYIARRFLPDAMDLEIVLYYILITLKPIMNKPFELVIDMTQFSGENHWNRDWINQFERIIPEEAIQNIQVIYFMNLNTPFHQLTKSPAMRAVVSKIGKRSVFINEMKEFAEYIHPNELRLPKSTFGLEREVTAIITPVTRILYRQQMPVVLKLSQENIQVQTARKVDILGGWAHLNDVFHISEIEDVLPSSGRPDDQEFIIKYAEKVVSSFGAGGSNTTISTMTFSSPKKEMIINAIRAARARFQLSRPSNIIADQRHLRPSDVPGTLLNMAMLNSGSDDANLRVASYNLLYALAGSFDFDVGNQLLSAKGLCIPANNQSFVVAISSRLAATEQHLTLEFMLECCLGFNKSSKELKHYCLEYMAPWLQNLANFCRPGMEYSSSSSQSDPQQQKLREILRLLIEITVKETEMYPLLQSKVWMALGQVEEIVPFVLEALLQIAVENGLGSQQAEVSANTAITLASVNMHLVAGKIISRLRKVINATSLTPTETLVDHPSWGEIAVLNRFILMLSFNDRLNVHQFLPELCHIVCMLVGIGAPICRSSLHGIVINIVQSLCTAVDLDEAHYENLEMLLKMYSDPKICLLFGLSGSGMVHHHYTKDGAAGSGWSSNTSNMAFLFSNEALTGDVQREVPLQSLDTVVNSLLEVMTYGTSDPELSATWKCRWMSLIASTAFQYNPSIQPRAFIALGCLARDDVDDDLLYQILVALRGALTLFEDKECHLIVSIIMSLCNIVNGLPEDSRYLKPMFWLAMSLLQIGHVPIFQSALQLLQVVLKALDHQGCFEEESVSSMLLRAREPIVDVLWQLDNAVGIHFRTDFSFAVAVNLLKGVKHSTTKTATTEVLRILLEISAKQAHLTAGGSSKVGLDRLGYILPLLPTSERLRELFWLAGVVEPSVDFDGIDDITGPMKYRKVLDRLAIPDEKIATLTISMMVTMLEHAEYETEVLFIYGFLAEAAVTVPEVFAVLYDSLLSRMTQVLVQSQTPQVVEAVQSILKTMVSLSYQLSVSSPRSGVGSAGPTTVMPPTSPQRRSAPPTPTTPTTAGTANMGGFAALANMHVPSGVTQASILNDLGFPGLPEAGSFQNVTRQRKVKNANLACAVVDAIIGL